MVRTLRLDTDHFQHRLVTLTALGAAYGDIGTSPLYALRECFHGELSVPLNEANVLGILSLADIDSPAGTSGYSPG